MWTKEQFEQMLKDNRIEDIHYEESKHGTNKYHLTKLYRRNKEQQEQAQTKAKQLKHNPWMADKTAERLCRKRVELGPNV